VARYWLINTAAAAVPLSAHPSLLVITTKLAAAILDGRLFGGGVLPAQYCPCGATPGLEYIRQICSFCRLDLLLLYAFGMKNALEYTISFPDERTPKIF